jgi:hypothetical protein
VSRIAPSPRGSRISAGEPCGYRAEVLASDIKDLVQSAGGWLFDQITAGWTVNVWTTDPFDIRPLQILGVPTVSADPCAGSTAGMQCLLAVSAALLGRNARAQEAVMTAVDDGNNDILLWGDVLPVFLHPHVCSDEHRLSNAARAFKAQALRAASVPYVRVAASETLYRCARSTLVESLRPSASVETHPPH